MIKQIAPLAILVLSVLSSATAEVIYNDTVDEFTGEDNSSVVILPTQGDDLTVGWKCFSGGLNVAIAHKYLAGAEDNRVSVRTKFGDDEPSSPAFYSLSRNNRFTFVDRFDVPIFTGSAINSEQFMVRITDPSDNEVLTATYKTDGLGTALSKLECYR
jgi:hypothetical protein